MKEKFTRRRLPHWDLPGAMYFITTCLEGSIPAQGRLEIEQMRIGLKEEPRPPQLSEADWKIKQWKELFVRRENWLDCQPGVRYLEDERLALVVERSLLHFADVRYELIAWVVMPSHYHWVFRPLEQWVDELGRSADNHSPRKRIQHSVNRHTAYECNLLLNRSGVFWQHESYDHCVRDEHELERIVAYIHQNPVRAGLVSDTGKYRFSSAYEGRARYNRAPR